MCKPKNNMKATVNVLCYKSKTLSNGENPLMICVSKVSNINKSEKHDIHGSANQYNLERD